MVTFTLFWLNLNNLVSPGLDNRLQEDKGLTEEVCNMRKDAMLITWSGNYVAWCQKE